MRNVFHKVQEATSYGKDKRDRIFRKVKDNLQDEIKEKQEQYKQMLAAQAEIEQQKIKKEQELKIKKEQEEVRKAKELEDQKLREELNRERTKIVEKLEEEKKLKALEILNVLLVKGFKKIGKEKIKDLIDHNKAEFNTVIDFY